MRLAPEPKNELERLKALYALKILDTSPEEVYDRITRVAANLFKVPMSTVCFIDEKRVWFKSAHNIEVTYIDRDVSVCGHTICQNIDENEFSRLYEIKDLKKDSRFSDNPLVINPPNIHYYLAYVLQSRSNHNIGTFCIMDTKPREMDEKDKALFVDLGKMIDEQLQAIDPITKFSFNDLAIASDVAYKVFDEIDILLKRKGISLKDWKVLDIVVHTEFATPSYISEHLGLACSQVSKILELLEAKGLIKRVRAVENKDRRLVKLECNEEGRKAWNYGKRVSDQVLDKLSVS